MSARFDPYKHHRRSIRLQGYDYARPGGYFITVVTNERECLFGEVVEGEVQLNDRGKIAEDCWCAIPDHFPGIELGIFVVMPNHIHGIINIATHSGGTMYRAPTTEGFGAPVAGSIPTIVRTYKAAVTRRIARELNGGMIWQRNYYEHIIRNEEDYNRIYNYIENNPARWEQDSEWTGGHPR